MDTKLLHNVLLSMSPEQSVKVFIFFGFVFLLSLASFQLIFIVRYMKRNQLLESRYSERMAKTEKALIETQQDISLHVLKELGRELDRNVTHPVALMKWKAELEVQKPHEEQNFDWVPIELSEYLDVIINAGTYLSKRPLLLNGFVYEIKLDVIRLRNKKKLNIDYEYQDSLFQATPLRGLYVFRLYQVLMSNVIQHSKATKVDISIVESATCFVFSFSDNGVGFKTSILENMKAYSLHTIFDRIKLIGGEIEYESILNNGTVCVANIPKS